MVAAGETVEVTDRGRPVAVLAPIPHRGALDHLRVTGDLVPASAGLEDLPAPLAISPSGPTPSEILAQLRRDER